MTAISASEIKYDPVTRADEIIEQLRKREIKLISKNLKFRIVRINHFLDVKMTYEETKSKEFLNHMTADYAQLVLNAYDILVANEIVESDIDSEKEMLKKKVLDLQTRLEDMEKIDKPNDIFPSEVKEDD